MQSFSAQDWILIIGAVGILINNTINNWKMSNKVDTINATAKVIEGHVNSATTKADERARAGEEREKALQVTITELRKSAALLAQALAIKGATGKITNIPTKETIDVVGDIETLAANLEIKPKSEF